MDNQPLIDAFADQNPNAGCQVNRNNHHHPVLEGQLVGERFEFQLEVIAELGFIVGLFGFFKSFFDTVQSIFEVINHCFSPAVDTGMENLRLFSNQGSIVAAPPGGVGLPKVIRRFSGPPFNQCGIGRTRRSSHTFWYG
jgi:hypothetical protein